MKKSVLVALVFIVIAGNVNAQGAKSVFLELGGPGLASVNFDMRLSGTEDGFGGRVGVGMFNINEVRVVFVPLGLNYLWGNDGKNYFELGGGVTPVIASDKLVEDDNFTSTFGYLHVGYRFQPHKRGLTFRAFITPALGSWGFFPYWGGVSIGYKF